MAPELLSGGYFTDKVDVYAFGILLNEMFCRRPPFSGVEPQRVANLVQRGDRPEIAPSIPADLKALIQACWGADAALRPDFRSIQAQLEALQGKVGG
jgi:serine/threonine protein kinase